MENELWEGINILSPEEMESSLAQDNNGNDDPSNNTAELEEPVISAPESTDSDREFDRDEQVIEDTNEEDSSENTSEDSSNEEQLNKYGALIKDLISDDILTTAEGEELEELIKDASADTIKDLMKQTVEVAFKNKEQSWKKTFTGAKKRFLEIEDAFEDTDYAIQMAQRLDYFESLDESELEGNTDLQKRLYFEYLKSKNFSDVDAQEAIEEADSINKLQDKAKKALPELKNEANLVVERSKKQKETRQHELAEQYEKDFNSLMTTIDSKEEFVPGLKLNKVIRDRVKQNITAPVYKDEAGKEYTSLMYKQKKNPSEFQMLINYYDSIGLFNVDNKGAFKPDISKLKKVAKTNAVSELDRVLDREHEQGTGRFNSQSTSKKSEGILSLLERAYSKK